jgi:AcrR family transcriptional regulator
MPRPRFFRLPDDKRRRILETAALELAARGFRGASLNRIISTAGISKGAAYYYFDDKADLFAAVMRHGWQALAPPRPFDLGALTRKTFWTDLEAAYRGLLARVQQAPWLTAIGKLAYGPLPSTEATDVVAAEFARARGWLRAIVERGQALGTIRRDVPADLLMATVAGAFEAADRWMVEASTSMSHDELDRLALVLFAMMRQVVAPPGAARLRAAPRRAARTRRRR